jgi:hypothetical protein
MTLAQITKMDVYAWGYHLWCVGVKGAATAGKATMTISTAGQISGQLIDWHVLGIAALGGAVWEILDYLAKNPGPKSEDFDEKAPTPIP